jgi:hypothetical protein
MKMGTNLLGVCVREGVTGGWLFVGRRVRALKDIWCGMALARYVNAFIDMYEEVTSITTLFNPVWG